MCRFAKKKIIELVGGACNSENHEELKHLSEIVTDNSVMGGEFWDGFSRIDDCSDANNIFNGFPIAFSF